MGHGQLDNPDKIVVKDEGVQVGVTRTINLVGGGVTAVPTNGIINIEVSGGGAMGSHSLLGGYHYMGPAGGSGDVLTNIGSGVTPTFSPPPLSAMATHAFGGGYHSSDTFANLLGKVSDAVLIKVGDSAASLTLWSGHLGSAGAHHTYPVPSGGVASGAVPHWELRGLSAADHHVYPVPYGGIGSGAVQSGNVGSGAIPHNELRTIGVSDHHTYPNPSGGVASGAVPFLELRNALHATMHLSGGGDPIAHGSLANTHGSIHALTHFAGAADPISHGSLASTHLYPIIVGGIGSGAVQSGNVASGAIPHAELRTIGANDHHNQAHTFGSSDHTADTFANFLTKINDAVPIKVGDSASSLGLWAGHLGSQSAHHVYPIGSGGVGSGAVLMDEIRNKISIPSGYSWQALASGGVPTWAAQLGGGGGISTHGFIGTYHKWPDVAASGNVLTALGNDSLPTFSVPQSGGISTHSFIGTYHAFGEGASGNVLVALGSGAIPTFAAISAGGMATHSIGGVWHNPDTWANLLTKINDAVPIKVGDSVASLALWSGHIGSAAAHHDPTHNIGGAYHVADTFANLSSKISDAVLIKVGDSAASLGLWAGHLGSQSAHFAYPVGSGGVASGAAALSELRGAILLGQLATHALWGTFHALGDAPSGYFLTGLGSGAIPTYSNLIFSGHVGSAGAHGNLPLANLPTHSLWATLHALGDAPSGYFLSGLGSGAIPTYSNLIFSGHVGSTGAHGVIPFSNLATHSLFASFHALGDAPSGYFLTGVGSGIIPTFSNTIFSGHVGSTGAHGVLPFANLPTHSFIGSFHAFGAGASGDVLTCLGSGAIPTYATPVSGGMQTHAFTGTYHAFGPGASGAALICAGSGSVPTFDSYKVVRSTLWYLYGTLPVGSQLSALMMADKQWTLLSVNARCKTAPSGDRIEVDIVNMVGTSIFASLPYIGNATTNSGVYQFGTAGIASGSWLQMDIDRVGSSHPGNDLTVQLTFLA